MSEELITLIAETEAQAEEIKLAATARAQEMLSDAEAEVLRRETEFAEKLRLYRENAIDVAVADAETRYQESMRAQADAAKDYCARALESAEESIEKIVGRIVRGDC